MELGFAVVKRRVKKTRGGKSVPRGALSDRAAHPEMITPRHRVTYLPLLISAEELCVVAFRGDHSKELPSFVLGEETRWLFSGGKN